MTPFDRLHKCRAAGPCWGCGGEIQRGQHYRNLVIWEQDGPCRTKRLHPECYTSISMMNRDEWEEFEPGTLEMKGGP